MPQIALELPANEDAPARAREALREISAGFDDEDVWRAEVIVTELVTNAVIHGAGGPVRLALDCGGNGLRGQVTDPGPGIHRRRATQPVRETGGRGLFLVGRLADGWGSAPDDSRVWFEVASSG
ncbi:MAG: ATP-binding protein [Thermoleophilaceae bacterium]